MSTPAPGWYPDPTDLAGKRWWDGEQWTQQTQIDLSDALPPAVSDVQQDADGTTMPGVGDAPPADLDAVPTATAGLRKRRRAWPWVAAGAGAVVLLGGTAGVVVAGRTPDVPDVVGQGAENAREALEDLDFEVAFRGEDVPDEDDLDHWTVSAQDPKPGDAGDTTEVRLWVSTPVTSAVKACNVPTSVGDNGVSVVLDVEGENYGSGDIDYLQALCVLTELDMPDSVWSKMEGTRALDGRQTAEWDDVEVTWSYHPDDGLDVIVELIN